MRRRASLVSLLTLACHVAHAPPLEPSPAVPTEAAETAAAESPGPPHEVSPPPSEDTTAVVSEPGPRCTFEMAPVERPQGRFCIDRWEASLVRSGTREFWPSNFTVDEREELIAASIPGRKPQGYINADEASRACANANKRLCTIDEWVRACRGPRGTTYPYGSQRLPNLCNDRYERQSEHPVVRLFERFAPPGTDRATMWMPQWMNDPRLHELPSTVEPTGARPACSNEYGVYDLVGNLHEWVADPDGTFVGGFFMDTIQNGEGCGYRTSAHDRRYHDYSTGFRCCSDALLD